MGRAGFEMSRADFEDAVADALDSVPPELARQMNNVVVLVEHDGPDDGPDDDGYQDDSNQAHDGHGHGGPLLGLYEGTPLTERGDGWAGALPDRITIFRRPILAICADREEVVREVRITVIHEIAHHFGIGDDRLDELGWG